jgi:N-acetylmuramoyl-L-alanine amidase
VKICISSGHGKYVRGACGIIDEVDEARKVTEEVADQLRARGAEVWTYHDDVSTSQNENLNRIVDWHESKVRNLDLSIHFNAYEQVSKPMGCEVLYLTQDKLAAKLSAAIACVGLIDRGAKQRTDLFFLNATSQPACLLEICFVDSTADCDIYGTYFRELCANIADVYAELGEEPPEESALFMTSGRCSSFGGPSDEGVDSDEMLAFIDDIMDAPQLFLPFQPDGTTGLARRLNPYTHYLACRWDYDVTPRSMLLNEVALVRAKSTGRALTAFPADWGPHIDTDRVADLSPSLLEDLGIVTDDDIEVIFPYRGS